MPQSNEHIQSSGGGYIRQLVATLSDTGDFFIHSRKFVKYGITDFEESGILQELMNIGAMQAAEDGWFTVTVEQMEDRTGYKRDAQTRVLNALAKKGLIRLARRGVPPKRQVWIDLEKIGALLVAGAGESRNGVSRSLINEKPRSLTNVKPRSTIERSSSLRSEQKEPVGNREMLAASPPRIPPGADVCLVPSEHLTGHEGHVNQQGAPWVGWAERLHDIVVNTHNFRQPWKRSSWAQTLRDLHLSDVGGDAARVEHVLAWYERNAKTYKLSPVCSAVKFRKRFLELEGFAKKEIPAKCDMVISDNTRKLAASLRDARSWPKGSGGRLEEVIEATVAAYTPWLDKLRAVRDGEGTPERTAEFIRELQSEALRTPHVFASWWLRQAHKSVEGWADWHGDLTKFVWRPDHPLFLKAMLQQCRSYAGPRNGEKMWDKLLEAMG